MANRRYEWADWFRAGQFSLYSGEHYTCSTASMIQQMRNWLAANLPGLHVKVIEFRDGFSAFVTADDLKKKNPGRPRKDAAARQA